MDAKISKRRKKNASPRKAEKSFVKNTMKNTLIQVLNKKQEQASVQYVVGDQDAYSPIKSDTLDMPTEISNLQLINLAETKSRDEADSGSKMSPELPLQSQPFPDDRTLVEVSQNKRRMAIKMAERIEKDANET